MKLFVKYTLTVLAVLGLTLTTALPTYAFGRNNGVHVRGRGNTVAIGAVPVLVPVPGHHRGYRHGVGIGYYNPVGVGLGYGYNVGLGYGYNPGVGLGYNVGAGCNPGVGIGYNLGYNTGSCSPAPVSLPPPCSPPVSLPRAGYGCCGGNGVGVSYGCNGGGVGLGYSY